MKLAELISIINEIKYDIQYAEQRMKETALGQWDNGWAVGRQGYAQEILKRLEMLNV